MPHPRRTSAAQFVDGSAQRGAVGDSDRAPVIRNRRQAKQYNQLQDVYAAALAPYATSALTKTKPQHVRVPKAKVAGAKPAVVASVAAVGAVPVLAVATAPVLPAALVKAKAVREPGQPTKAALERKAKDKAEAEVRRSQPGQYAFKRGELAAVQRLNDQGVNRLTECVREKKKTLNYDAKVVPFTVHGVKRYRLVSKCRSCFAEKSTFLSSGAKPPSTVHGGRLSC